MNLFHQPGSESRALILIIILGCSLRLFYAFWVPDEISHQTGFPDSYNYWSIAHNLATDFQYANSWQAPGNNPRWGDSGLTSFREPMFPLLLALEFKLFGESPRSAFVMQALLGTLTIPLCFGIGAMLFSARAALLGALLESVNPYHIYSATFISTENIASVILLAVVFCTLRVLRSIDAGKPIPRSDLTMLIFSLSGSVLTRAVFASSVLVTFIFVGAASYRKSAALAPAARTVGLLMLLTAVCASPWFIRNYFVWHTFVYHTNVGQVMVMGFNDLATGGDDDETRFMDLDRALAPYGYNEVERNRIYIQEAYEWIRSHPGRAVYLSIKKQVMFWSPIPAVVKGYPRLVGIMWSSAFLTLMLTGLVRARSNSFAENYVLAIIFVYSLFHSLAIAVTRYRVPLEGVLAVFAGYGLDFLLPTLQSQVQRHLPRWIANILPG